MANKNIRQAVDKLEDIYDIGQDIHQFTIDTLEDVINDLIELGDDETLTRYKFNISKDSWHYRLTNILEVMRTDIPDNAKIQEVMKIMEETEYE